MQKTLCESEPYLQHCDIRLLEQGPELSQPSPLLPSLCNSPDFPPCQYFELSSTRILRFSAAALKFGLVTNIGEPALKTKWSGFRQGIHPGDGWQNTPWKLVTIGQCMQWDIIITTTGRVTTIDQLWDLVIFGHDNTLDACFWIFRIDYIQCTLRVARP